MAELLVFHDFEKVDPQRFLRIFKESGAENAARWYPELSRGAALQKYEDGFLHYMKEDFWNEGGTLFLLSEDGEYVSSLRLYEKAEHDYFLEALETHPAYRRRGYGKEILLQTERYLSRQMTDYTVTAYVEKENTASLRAHLAAGFRITADYVTEDGERFDSDYQLTYNPSFVNLP